MSAPTVTRPIVAVWEAADVVGRDLASTVRACDLDVIEAPGLTELAALLARRECLVALIAFEAIWQDPQQAVKRLRQVAPDARLVIAYAEGTPRLHLGRRLWAVNLIDYFVLRSTPPHEMRPVLRQAYAEALIEVNREGVADSASPAGHEHYAAIRFISELSQAFNTQRRVEDLLRLLHRKLVHLVEYDLLQVLTVEEGTYRLFVYPTSPLRHEVIWDLAGATCAAVKPFLPGPIDRADLVTFENGPFSASELGPRGTTADGTGSNITLPMVVHGELVGCMSVLIPQHVVLTAENHMFLRLVSTQLGAAIRNAQALEAAENQSLIDELTGVRNRRYLAVFLPQEWRRTERYNLQLSVAMLDIDWFKRINDTHGHLVGDDVLRQLARILRHELRDTDEVIRFGGEEFLILMPETRPSEAIAAVERVHAAIKREPLYSSPETGPITITVSAGVSSYPLCPVQSVEELIHCADEALYEAKTKGRDQVCMSTGQAIQAMRRGPVAGDSGAERRRVARIDSELPIRYIELPDFEGRLRRSTTINISSTGVALLDPRNLLRTGSYALVYVGESDAPVLGRVAWSREVSGNQQAAGIEFLKAADIEARVRVTQRLQVLPKAMVIVEDSRTAEVVARVLRAAHYDMHIVSTRDDLPPPSELSRFALVVVGESSLGSWFGQQLETVREGLRAPGRIVVISEGGDLERALGTVQSHRVDHLVPVLGSDEALFTTLNKLLLGEYFGMHKYLLWGVTPKSWTIGRRSQKEVVLAGIRAVARDVHCHPRIADLLILAVEEMLINAMYHGSDDKQADQLGPIRVECGSDGRLLAVAVVDDKGLLRYGDLYRGLGMALRQQREGIPAEATSANLGFRIMLSCLSQLAINIDPGRCTEIIGIVDLRKSLRDYRMSIPTLGLFSKERPA